MNKLIIMRTFMLLIASLLVISCLDVSTIRKTEISIPLEITPNIRMLENQQTIIIAVASELWKNSSLDWTANSPDFDPPGELLIKESSAIYRAPESGKGLVEITVLGSTNEFTGTAKVTFNINEKDSTSFGELIFCSRDNFDSTKRSCLKSTKIFEGVVEILYLSWVPSEEYVGASFKRIWYIDGIEFLTRENNNEYAYLEVSQRKSLKPGQYTVKLYANGTLIQTGDFTIR